MKDDIGRDFDESEGCACALVEGEIAVMTVKNKIVQILSAFERSGSARQAMRTVLSVQKAGDGIGVAQLSKPSASSRDLKPVSSPAGSSGNG